MIDWSRLSRSWLTPQISAVSLCRRRRRSRAALHHPTDFYNWNPSSNSLKHPVGSKPTRSGLGSRSRQKQFLNSHGIGTTGQIRCHPAGGGSHLAKEGPDPTQRQPRRAQAHSTSLSTRSRLPNRRRKPGRPDSQAGYPIYGSSIKVADQLEKGRLLLTKRLRKMINGKADTSALVAGMRSWCPHRTNPRGARHAVGALQHRDHEVYIQSRLDDYPVCNARPAWESV